MEVIELIFPVFAVIVTGYLFARMEIIPAGVGDALIQFLFYVAIPALLFVVIAQQDIKDLLNWPFIFAFGGATYAAFLLLMIASRFWLKADLGSSTTGAMVAVAANTGIIGLPLLHALFGQKAVVLAGLANIIVVLLLLLQTILLESARSDKADSSESTFTHLKKAVLNPVVLSTLLGLVYAITPFGLPKLVTNYLDVLGAAVAPCALFAVGMSIKPASILESGRLVLFYSGVKLVALPLLALVITLMLDANPLVSVAAVVSAALPTAKNEYILAKQYHQSEDIAGETIALTTAVSVVTLVVWLLVLSRIFPDSFSI